MHARPGLVLALGLALALASVLSACATSGDRAPMVLEGTTWRIVEVDGTEVRRADDVNLTPHLRVISAEGRVHGAGGCNRFSGPYRAGGSTLEIGPLVSTRRACVDPARQDQETRMVEVLQAADGYTIDGRRLSILVRGEPRMTLEAW